MKRSEEGYTLAEWMGAVVDAHQKKQAFKLAKLVFYGYRSGYTVLVEGKTAEELEALIGAPTDSVSDKVDGSNKKVE